MSYDEEFEQFREECLQASRNTIEAIIGQWLHSHDLQVAVGYSRDYHVRKLTLYTDKPGWLIGPQGKYIQELHDQLSAEYGSPFELKVHEITGGFVQMADEEDGSWRV